MNIQTEYLGLKLRSPLVPSASPLSESLDNIRLMEDYGAGAIVLYSLFEEQIEHESHEIDHFLSMGTESYPESLSYFPDMEAFNTGPEEYLGKIVSAVDAVDIPIIGSLNGISPGGWTRYAKRIEEAGAAALELNIYFIATDASESATIVEQRYLSVIQEVSRQVSIPVSVKLSPFFTATAHFAHAATYAGAKGLVLFNRFFQPDFDLEKLEVVPRLQLSDASELRLPLRWIAILYGRIDADLALTTGVHTHEDVLKGLMAGANVTMMASELMQNGIERLATIRDDMIAWLEEREYESVEQLRGSMSQIHVEDEAAFERANYMKTLKSWHPDPTGALY